MASSNRPDSDTDLPIRIDPTQLNHPEHQELLLKLLRTEESKHADKVPGKERSLQRKEWLADKTYPVEADPRRVSLRHEISRSPKRYGAVFVLGDDEKMPNDDAINKKRKETGLEAIYLTKNSDGIFWVCAGTEPPKELTRKESNKLSEYLASIGNPSSIQKNLEHHFELYEARLRWIVASEEKNASAAAEEKINIGRLTQQIKEKNRKQISAIQNICGYSGYRYQVTTVPEDKVPLGTGNFGIVNAATGRLVIEKDKDGRDSIKYEAYPEEEWISKLIKIENTNRPALRQASAENEITILSLAELQQIFATGTPTIQKDWDGNVISIRYAQKRARGRELARLATDFYAEWRNEKGIHSLSESARRDLVPFLLKALTQLRNKDKETGKTTGVVHRDIKLDNIMFYTDPGTGLVEVRIVDFGAARSLARKDGRYCGTPETVPPEMAAACEDDDRSDDYSLGMALWELLEADVFFTRKKILRKEYARDFFLSAEYYLNIAPEKPKFPSLEGLNTKDMYEKTFHEMTLPSSVERLSAENALARLEGKPEEKRASGAPQFNHEKGLVALERLRTALKERGDPLPLRSGGTLRYFLRTTLTQLGEYAKTLDLASDSYKFLEACHSLCHEPGERPGSVVLRKIPNDMIPLVATLLSRALYNEKYLNEPSQVEEKEKERAFVSNQLNKIVIHHYKPRKKKRDFSEYMSDAWNETYLRSMSPEERKGTNLFAYLIGWPGGKGGGAWFSYVFFGFILTPIKNILKIPEFLTKCASQLFNFLLDRAKQCQPTVWYQKAPLYLWLGFLGLFYIPITTAAWVISAVTSPMANFRAGLDEEQSFLPAIASACVTLAAYIAIVVVAAPLAALVALKLFGVTASMSPVPALGDAFASVATAIFLAARWAGVSFVEKRCAGKKQVEPDTKQDVSVADTGSPAPGKPPLSSTARAASLAGFKPELSSSVSKSSSSTPPSPTSRDSSAGQRPSLLEQQRDTPATASVPYKQSAPGLGQRSASE